MAYFLTLNNALFFSKLFVCSAEPVQAPVGPMGLVTRVLVRQLVHGALHLRALVRANLENSDLVFWGFPVGPMAPATEVIDSMAPVTEVFGPRSRGICNCGLFPMAPATEVFGTMAPATDIFSPMAPATDVFDPIAPATMVVVPMAAANEVIGPKAQATEVFGSMAPTTEVFGPMAPATEVIGSLVPSNRKLAHWPQQLR